MPKRKRYLDNGGKPDRKTVYKAKYTGRIFSTAREAAIDNTKYLREPINRFDVKSKEYPRYKELNIPFIEEKRRTLSNAGLATGAVISENLLDSIAKYADIEGLPLKTALGLVTKESTLGNPTDDKSVYKLLGEDKALFFKRGGGGQFINKGGQDVDARGLVNYYKDTWNPYEEAIKIAKIKATGSNGVFVKPVNWGNDNNPNYLEALDEYNKQKAIFDKTLIEGEKYADRQAEKKRGSIRGNVLQAAFRDYKNNPNGYNPGQRNYTQLVERRGNEVWNSPEIQNWYKNRTNKRNGGRISLRNGGRLQFRGGGKKPITTGGAGYIPENNGVKAVKNAVYNYVTGGLPISEVRQRLYNNIVPAGYGDAISRVRNAVVNNKKEDNDKYMAFITNRYRKNLWAEYLQIPKDKREYAFYDVENSPYRPTIADSKGIKYKRVTSGNNLGVPSNMWWDVYDELADKKEGSSKLSWALGDFFGHHTISRGHEKGKGSYISYYDVWDLSPFRGNGRDESQGIGKPIHLYDRAYLDDLFNIEAKNKGAYWLPEVEIIGKRK